MSAEPLPAPLTRNGQPLWTRDATVSVRAAADNAPEVVELSLSSEAPVLRYDWRTDETYYEVLAHTPEAVDLSRAANGLPFLAEHYRTDLIGRLTNVRLEGGRLVASVRFSEREDAQGIVTDIRTGIRPDVSIGYLVGDEYAQEQREGEQHPTRRYLRWMPYEGSSVSIPADYAVGIGRSAHAAHITPKAETRPEVAMENSEKGAAAAVVAEPKPDHFRSIFNQVMLSGVAGERASDVDAMARAYAESGKDLDTIGRELIAKQVERAKAAPSPVQLTEKEEQDYSYTRLINTLAAAAEGKGQRAGFEIEVGQEIAARLGNSPKHGGVFVPATTSKRYLTEQHRTQLSVGAANKGAELKFTQYGGFIDLLRTRMQIFNLGAQYLPGLRDDLSFVPQTAAGTFTWGTETANASLSSLSLGARNMSPKVGQSATTFTRQLMRQSVESIEGLVRNDLLNIHARGIQRAALHGTGTGSEPRGIANIVGVATVPLGTNGAAPAFPNVVQMETEVTADNADIATMGYLANARGRGFLKTLQQFAGTNGVPVWTGGMEGEMNGYRAYVTNDVRSDLTKGSGTNLSAIFFGCWDQLLVGEWGAAEITVDPYTSGPALLKVTSYQLIDIQVRYPEAFSVIVDAIV